MASLTRHNRHATTAAKQDICALLNADKRKAPATLKTLTNGETFAIFDSSIVHQRQSSIDWLYITRARTELSRLPDTSCGTRFLAISEQLLRHVTFGHFLTVNKSNLTGFDEARRCIQLWFSLFHAGSLDLVWIHLKNKLCGRPPQYAPPPAS